MTNNLSCACENPTLTVYGTTWCGFSGKQHDSLERDFGAPCTGNGYNVFSRGDLCVKYIWCDAETTTAEGTCEDISGGFPTLEYYGQEAKAGFVDDAAAQCEEPYIKWQRRLWHLAGIVRRLSVLMAFSPFCGYFSFFFHFVFIGERSRTSTWEAELALALKAFALKATLWSMLN